MGRYFETVNILFLSKLSYIKFSIWWCFLAELLLWWLPNDGFPVLSFPHISWHSTMKKRFLFSLLLVWTHKFLFYSSVTLICFNVKLFHIWSVGDLLGWLLSLFDMFLSFLWEISYSPAQNVPSLSCCFPFTHPWKSAISPKILSFI